MLLNDSPWENEMRGRVMRLSGRKCLVEAQGKDWQCDVSGRLKNGIRHATSPVVVGDWVDFSPTVEAGQGVIKAVHPRTTKFSRLAVTARPYEQVVAANLELLVVMVAARNPTLSTGFVDRAVVMALKGGLEPVVCINKADLDPERQTGDVALLYRRLGYQVFYTSALNNEGIDQLGSLLKDRLSLIVGHSGVGKSSLLNRLEPGLDIQTKALMKRHDRGQHTTAAVQLHALSQGGYVADTPGVKELQMWQVGRHQLIDYFTDLAAVATGCHFRNCIHLHEPSCQVRGAVEAELVALSRYEGYCRILQSLD